MGADCPKKVSFITSLVQINVYIKTGWLQNSVFLFLKQRIGLLVSCLILLESGNSDKKMNQELERKLRHLKHLYDQELIEEEEYKVQQKNLFEKLF